MVCIMTEYILSYNNEDFFQIHATNKMILILQVLTLNDTLKANENVHGIYFDLTWDISLFHRKKYLSILKEISNETGSIFSLNF